MREKELGGGVATMSFIQLTDIVCSNCSAYILFLKMHFYTSMHINQSKVTSLFTLHLTLI